MIKWNTMFTNYIDCQFINIYLVANRKNKQKKKRDKRGHHILSFAGSHKICPK